MTEPVALQVQWLEEGLLVHAVTVARTGPSVRLVNQLGAAALASLGIAAAAEVWGGDRPLALSITAVFAAIGLGCGAALARTAWLQRRTTPAPPRRLLVEIGRDRLAWTLIDGERWSMTHDHELRLREVMDARSAAVDAGGVVRVRAADGRQHDVPLHGLPVEDVHWLVSRIEEAAGAARSDV